MFLRSSLKPSLQKGIEMELSHLPAPSNLSYSWNFGSLLASALLVQICSGLILSVHYSSDIQYAFTSVMHVTYDVHMGWMTRSLHANGASMLFLLMYVHVFRGLWHGSYRLSGTWWSGLAMLTVMMGTAFVGYVLPWGQMSYWGATVITNLVSALPYVGTTTVEWLWGGFSVSNPTLERFYTLHFLLPMVMVAVLPAHLLALHSTGSSNPLGLSNSVDTVFFMPYFSSKDLVGVMTLVAFYMTMVFAYPSTLLDPINFMEADSIITPTHIQPEWYFLFAYAILRSVPTKLGGVVALLFSVLVLAFLPFKGQSFYKMSPLRKLILYSFLVNWVSLTWLGSMPIEEPFTLMSKLNSMAYFLCTVLL
nr:cytochrome b [Proechinophthirus fluctus]